MAMDQALFQSRTCLVAVDKYSNFILLHCLGSESTRAITDQLTKWFNLLGRPVRQPGAAACLPDSPAIGPLGKVLQALITHVGS